MARTALSFRYALATTVPGKRRYHFWEPQQESASNCTIQYKELNIDQEFTGKYNFGAIRPFQSMPRQGEYEACAHGHKWSIGLITKVVADDAELKVDFLHQSGPSNHFKWPERTDERTVSICDLLLVIDAPLTRNGRTFSVTELIVRKINEVFSKTC